MNRRILKNKPLVEAMLEVRWKLVAKSPAVNADPHYKLLLARIFDRMQAEYPEYEQLPSAAFPDDLLSHVVQHRFRVGPDKWPLLQIGPGILTVNSTTDYTWEDFRPRAISAFARLFESHPKPDSLVVTNLILRYIDAVEFDYANENAFQFLREKLKVDLKLPNSLFGKTEVIEQPLTMSWQSSFKCAKPPGVVMIQFGLGQKDGVSAVLWDTNLHSADIDVPLLPTGFASWLDDAHAVTSDWFFKLIDGDLERRFSGE